MILGLHAHKRAGKDSLADMLQERLGYQKIAFATPLYRGLKVMFPFIEPAYYEDRNKVVPALGKSVNQLLQSLGTEWGRNMVNEGVWVYVAGKTFSNTHSSTLGANVVFTDIRYENEAQEVYALGGAVIHIVGRGSKLNDHSSEIGIPDKYIDYTIRNDGTKEDLWKALTDLPLSI